MKYALKNVDNIYMESDIYSFLNPIIHTIPIWYEKYLLKNVELYPIELDHANTYEVYIKKLGKNNEPIVFGKLYSFYEVVKNYSLYNHYYNNRIDLYPNTILIGEEMNNGYFFLRTFKNGTYKIGFWDHDYIISEWIDEETLPNNDDAANEQMNPHNSYYLADSFEEFFKIWEFVSYPK